MPEVLQKGIADQSAASGGPLRLCLFLCVFSIHVLYVCLCLPCCSVCVLGTALCLANLFAHVIHKDKYKYVTTTCKMHMTLLLRHIVMQQEESLVVHMMHKQAVQIPVQINQQHHIHKHLH